MVKFYVENTKQKLKEKNNMLRKEILEYLDDAEQVVYKNSDNDMVHVDTVYDAFRGLRKDIIANWKSNEWTKCDNDKYDSHVGFCSENCPIITNKEKTNA